MFNVLTLKDQQVKDENHTEITGTEKDQVIPYGYRNGSK